MTFSQKILCLGNETENTDHLVCLLAQANNTVNHGLITDASFVPMDSGYYHTTVVDLPAAKIVELAKYFDQITMLDQPKQSYPHWKSYVHTFRFMYDLEQAGYNVDYLDKQCNKNMVYWHKLLRENKSICMYPFFAVIDNLGSRGICVKSPEYDVGHIDSLEDWVHDTEMNTIRQRMLTGQLNPQTCHACYTLENENQESARQYETLEWAARMDFESIDTFGKVNPMYYEIRPSNKCNMMCRTCDNQHSHLIEKEYKSIGIPLIKYTKQNRTFDEVNFESLEKLYVGGGEPTIMPEFYEFLQKCIYANKTNFELFIGTNGLKFSDKLLNLLDHFSDVCFSVSFDGYKKVNDYIRWGADFDTIHANSKMLIDRGHTVALQTVFTIYNATNIHEIFEFYDREFPNSSCLVNYGVREDDIISPYNHPDRDAVLRSMERCQKTNVYYANGRQCKSQVDAMISQYGASDHHCDIEKLKLFFEYNDKLDRSRGVKLLDYIPELETARSLLS
jgi:sulfatase maturation enzyme AslB (radical SAM superfamily)